MKKHNKLILTGTTLLALGGVPVILSVFDLLVAIFKRSDRYGQITV